MDHHIEQSAKIGCLKCSFALVCCLWFSNLTDLFPEMGAWWIHMGMSLSLVAAASNHVGGPCFIFLTRYVLNFVRGNINMYLHFMSFLHTAKP